MQELRSKFEQSVGWLLLAVLLGGCLLVLLPFVSALLWALVLSFSIWPLYQKLVVRLGGRRTLAATLVASALILIGLLPFVIAGVTLADNVQELKTVVRRWVDEGPPKAPEWLAKVPMVGKSAVNKWEELAADSTKLLAEVEKYTKKYIEPVTLWFLKSGLTLTKGVLELALSILISFFFLRDGTKIAERLNVSIGRIAGQRGQHLLEVAGKTVRGVVYGILGTALLQAVFSGIGFLIAGVPGAAFLALITFVLCLLPAVGAPLVWIPAALWLFHQDATGRAIFLCIWGTAVSLSDNFVKPWLISHGSDMPFVLIFFGVIGGALAFGFIGFFIGPTLLAVGYKLAQEWIGNKPANAAS